jgi:hypothetical protein
MVMNGAGLEEGCPLTVPFIGCKSKECGIFSEGECH